MTVIAVLVGLCALAVVVLAYLVSKLTGQVRQLGSELAVAERRADEVERRADEVQRRAGEVQRRADEVQRRADEVQRRAEASERRAEASERRAAAVQLVAAPPAPEAPQQVLAVAEEVPVITALPDDDDLDITARRVASVTLARPLIKVASLSYGLRHAFDDERRFKVRYAMRHEFRRQRKMRRRRRAGRAPSMGWRS